MGQLFTFSQGLKSRGKGIETIIKPNNAVLKSKEVEDNEDSVETKTGSENKNAENRTTGKEVHRPQNNKFQLCVNNLPHQCSK